MKIEGILEKKIEERSGMGPTGNPWKIASYLIYIPGIMGFERRITMDVSDGEGGRIAQFDKLIGQGVSVLFDINAREWQGKWYNTVRAYSIQKLAEATATTEAAPSPQPEAPQPQAPASAPATSTTNEDDEPPF